MPAAWGKAPGRSRNIITFVLREFGSVRFISLERPGLEDELAFTTGKSSERELAERAGRLKGIGSIRNVVNIIRVEEE
jgi:hypothetical protein